MVSLRDRAVLPGALLAMLVTAAAVLALVLALGIRGEGPLSLLLGGADGAARLQDGPAAAPPGVTGDPGVRLGPPTPSAGAPAVVLPAAAGAPAAAPRRRAALRGETRTRVPARRSPERAPSRSTPAPVGQSAPSTGTAPKPAATAAPAPAVKVRGHGKPKPTTSVPKARIRTSAPPAPAPRAADPVVELRPAQPAQPPVPATGGGVVLKRVPGPPQ